MRETNLTLWENYCGILYIAVTSVIKLLEFITLACMQPHVSGWNESVYYSTDCLQKVHLWRSISGSNEPLYYLTQEDQVMMCAFDRKKSLIRLSSVYVLLHHLFVAGIACWQRVHEGWVFTQMVLHQSAADSFTLECRDRLHKNKQAFLWLSASASAYVQALAVSLLMNFTLLHLPQKGDNY